MAIVIKTELEPLFHLFVSCAISKDVALRLCSRFSSGRAILVPYVAHVDLLCRGSIGNPMGVDEILSQAVDGDFGQINGVLAVRR